MNLLRAVGETDLQRMRANLDVGATAAGRSRFWVLLALAAVIAATGVVADSTATVIGAMIVAPLMTPILGSVLAVVTGDRGLLLRSATLVVTGALAAIAVGYLIGALTPLDVVAASNGQVAARVHPRLIDLVAALATGTVGAFAQCREDVSDTLPGVAIAISLVPPLTVVGLTMEAGAFDEAGGALLLFGTNVAAILLSGSLVMAFHRVHRITLEDGRQRFRRDRAAWAVAAFALVVVVPLSASTARLTASLTEEAELLGIAEDWAEPEGWTIIAIDRLDGGPTITAAGEAPAPDPAALRQALVEGGLPADQVRIRFLPEVVLDAGG